MVNVRINVGSNIITQVLHMNMVFFIQKNISMEMQNFSLHIGNMMLRVDLTGQNRTGKRSLIAIYQIDFHEAENLKEIQEAFTSMQKSNFCCTRIVLRSAVRDTAHLFHEINAFPLHSQFHILTLKFKSFSFQPTFNSQIFLYFFM